MQSTSATTGGAAGLQWDGPVAGVSFPVLKRVSASFGKRPAGSCSSIPAGTWSRSSDDLISIGLSCFNTFQPEVMDVYALMERYRGRLSFNGGLSIPALASLRHFTEDVETGIAAAPAGRGR